MPQFYFDLRDGGDLHRDEIGESFDTGEDAEAVVGLLMADMVRDAPAACPERDVSCELRDEAGRTLFRGELTFRSFRLQPGG